MSKDTIKEFNIQIVFENILDERKKLENFEFWLIYMSYKKNSKQRKDIRTAVLSKCFSEKEAKKANYAFNNWLSGKTKIPYLYAMTIHNILSEYYSIEFIELFPNYAKAA